MSAIPEFPEFRSLHLEDRELLTRALASLGGECSEFTFATFFLFRCSAQPALSRLDEALFLRETCRGGGWCLLPPMMADRPAEIAARALHILAEADIHARHFASVTDKSWNEIFDPAGRFERAADRDNFDYVYERKLLAELPGNRFHRKKNLISQFTRRYSYEYRRLTPELVEPARDMADRWCLERGELSGPSSVQEGRALKEGLGRAEELDLTCGLILVDGRVEAVTMGERLNEDTAVVHFEKANPNMKGLAQVVNREFAAREFTDCRYFNREQDLGDPGLRRAKERYYPAHMVQKYVVGLAGDDSLDRHFEYCQQHRKVMA